MKVSEFYQQHLCGFCYLLCVTLEHLTDLSLDLVFIYVVFVVQKFQMYYSTDFLVCSSIAPRNNVCGAREFSVKLGIF